MSELELLIERLDGVSVLYVEDDEIQRAINKKTFLKLFNTIEMAEDGEVALQKYKNYFTKHDTFYDLIITDLVMPNLDGIGLIEALIALNPEQNIIVLSAQDEIHNLRVLMDLGIDAFITKPIRSVPLFNVMNRVSQRIYIKQKNEQYLREIENLNKKLMAKNKELESKINLSNEELAQSDIENVQSEGEVAIEVKEALVMDLPDLIDIHEDLDILILACIGNQEYSKNFSKISNNLNRFGAMLSCYHLLMPLAIKIEELSAAMKTVEPPNERLEEIFTIIESFVNTLGNWLKVWQSDEVVDVSYFNDSMIMDMNLILNLWSDIEAEGEIEFF